MWLGLLRPLIANTPWCMCTHPIDPMGVHLLCCFHGNECTCIHDAVRDTFTAIVQDVSFHVGRKQLHAFPSSMLNFFHSQINIVLTKDGIHTLVDVVIIDPTRTNLLFWFCTTQGFVAFDVIQMKERNYCNWHLINQFLPLEVFGCLHKQINVFLHDCLELERARKPSSFCFSYLSSTKKFNHCKGCNNLPF